MGGQFSRTQMLFGKAGMDRLHSARVAVFGVGGVGGYAVEALARSGIGTLDLIDPDTICESNLNRQIIALHSTLGRCKVDVARERVLDINPDITVNCFKTFFMPDTAEQFCFADYDYVVDAIDTVTGKIELAVRADRAGVPLISSMGAGNKLDAAAFEVADLFETSVCPLAKVMRRELKKRNIRNLKVVYSREKALTPLPEDGCDSESAGSEKGRRQTPGSTAFVPSVAGLILAGEVVRDILDFSAESKYDEKTNKYRN